MKYLDVCTTSLKTTLETKTVQQENTNGILMNSAAIVCVLPAYENSQDK